MSDYTQNVFFTPKDALSTGEAAKRIKGSEMDAELDEISTAIATKENTANKGAASGYCGLDAGGLVAVADLPVSTATAAGIVELATTAEVVTGTDTTRAVTAAGVEAWGAQNGGMVQDISNLADPNADQLLGWDDSAGAVVGFTMGSQLAFSGTTIICTVDLGNLSATNLTSGTIPAARVGASSVTQHQAALTILESQITDSTVLARVGSTETISAVWTFAAIPKYSGAGAFPHYASATQAVGAITVSTSAASGTPGAGDLWIQYTA